MTRIKTSLLLACSLLLISNVSDARNLRSGKMIKTPANEKSQKYKAPDGHEKTEKKIKLDHKLIKSAYAHLFKSWGTADMNDVLADNFNNKRELLDSVSKDIPMNAKIRLIGVDSIRVLSQYISDIKGKNGYTAVSIVVAEVTTEVVYQNSELGHQTIKGTGEYTIEMMTEGHGL